jgi:hypothetical protein
MLVFLCACLFAGIKADYKSYVVNDPKQLIESILFLFLEGTLINYKNT